MQLFSRLFDRLKSGAESRGGGAELLVGLRGRIITYILDIDEKIYSTLYVTHRMLVSSIVPAWIVSSTKYFVQISSCQRRCKAE